MGGITRRRFIQLSGGTGLALMAGALDVGLFALEGAVRFRIFTPASCGVRCPAVVATRLNRTWRQ
jgi:hypothetical protein